MFASCVDYCQVHRIYSPRFLNVRPLPNKAFALSVWSSVGTNLVAACELYLAGNPSGDTQSFTVPYPNMFVDWISMNRKPSLLKVLGVKVGIYCARRLIKHLEVFAKQLWKATVSFFVSVCIPVCLSLWNTSARKGWIFIKFYVGVLLWCCVWTLKQHKRTKKTPQKRE